MASLKLSSPDERSLVIEQDIDEATESVTLVVESEPRARFRRRFYTRDTVRVSDLPPGVKNVIVKQTQFDGEKSTTKFAAVKPGGKQHKATADEFREAQQ